MPIILIPHEIQLRMQSWLCGIWCLLHREHPGLALTLTLRISLSGPAEGAYKD